MEAWGSLLGSKGSLGEVLDASENEVKKGGSPEEHGHIGAIYQGSQLAGLAGHGEDNRRG